MTDSVKITATDFADAFERLTAAAHAMRDAHRWPDEAMPFALAEIAALVQYIYVEPARAGSTLYLLVDILCDRLGDDLDVILGEYRDRIERSR
jgi:hypothetical protein